MSAEQHTEEWRPIPEFPLYEVSNKGRIRSFQRKPVRILALRMSGNGYQSARLVRNGANKTVPIHRHVAAAFVGPRPSGMQINHKNGVKTDNRAENLEYVTPRDNIRHSMSLGLSVFVRGSRNGAARFTEDQVREMRARSAAGESRECLVQAFSISRAHLDSILRGAFWKHVSQLQ